MHSQTKRVRFVTWTFIILFVTAGTGLYFWSQKKYGTRAGVVTSSPAIADTTLTTGLVGYWTFDRAHVTWADTTTEIKDTAGTNHGNALGSLAAGSLALGKQGQALTFNGTSDYVDIGTSFDISAKPFTLSAWVYPVDRTDFGTIFAKRDSWVSNDMRFSWTLGSAGYGGVVYMSSPSTSLVFSNEVPLNTWTHLTVVVDTSTTTLFMNGVFNESLGSFTLGTDATASVRIGNVPDDGDQFSGKIDDVRVYNRALSATEVSRLYTMGTNTINAPVEDPLSQSLLGYWKMDEGTGTSTTADSSGNATTLTMTVMESGDWVTGQIGPYSLDFDGAAEYLTAADPAVLDFADGASFSLTGWFNRDLAADDDTIIAKKTNQTTNVGYTVWIDNNASTDYLFFEASDGTDTYQIQSTTDFSATGWHHFAISWNDNSALTTPVNLYIDGALNNGTTSGTFANVGDLSASNTNAFRIGAESGTADNFFDGKLDDIRVYGSPLSAGDVLKLYQTTAPAQPVDTGLVGHWTFDGPDIQGTIAIDRSSFGNNGAITGTTKTIGKLGQGLSFNGTSDYVDAGAVSLDITSTFSFWFKTVAGPTSVILSVRFRDCRIDYGPTGTLACTLDGGSNFITSGQVNNDNQWHHGVYTIASGQQNLYVDGVLRNSSSFSFSDDADDTLIGQRNFGAENFSGQIDDVRIYNRVLSATEVANLYNMGK